MRWILAVIIFLAAAPIAQAQTVVGYDALGRVKCVKQPSGKHTVYSYDAAGNRTQKTVDSSPAACASQSAGSPPSMPVILTATNPASTVASQSSTNYSMASLGAASDSATLALESAFSSGGAGSCGSASVTATTLTFVAPLVTPSSNTLVCYVNYVYEHPNGQHDAGRITVTIQGENP